MAQHDYNLANQSGADFRADLNNALSAIVTVNSGATAPSTTFAHQLWVDTSSSVLKIRNSANDAWVTTGVSITADNTFAGNLTGNVTGNVTGDITGNADTATALETARTINGTSFDGTANISFDTDSVSEGSANLYYTSARFDSAFSGKSTTNLSEGSNLYYTDARSRAAISATGDISYNSTTGVISFTETTAPVTSVFGRTGVVVATSGDYTTAQVTESGNLYYTDARVQAVSINNVVEDTTPQLGGNLDLNSNNITGTGNIDVTGTVTSDGLTVDGEGRIEETGDAARLVVARTDNANAAESASMDLLESTATGGSFGTASNYGFRLDIDGSANTFNIKSGVQTSVTKRFQIGRDTGDISFYDDTGSTQGLFWDSSAESLGIGTTAPAGNLHIKSTGNVGDALLIVEADADNNVESDNPRIELRQDGNLVSGALYLEGDAGTTATNALENSLLLDAKGASSNGGTIQFATGGLAANQSGGPTNSAVRMTILRDGNVGIGTDSPSSVLEIAKNDQTNGATLSITNSFEGGGWSAGDTVGTINFRVDDSSTTQPIRGQIKLFDDLASGSSTYPYANAMSFSTGYLNTLNERMRISSDGSVGIGTTSPSQPLEVDGNIQATGTRSISALYDSNHYMRIEANSSGGILKGTDGGVITTLVRTYGDSYFNGGNVGIGNTAPAKNLHITDSSSPTIRFSRDNSFYWDIGHTSSDFQFISESGGTVLHMNYDGNIGIGTDSPSSILEIADSGVELKITDTRNISWTVGDTVASLGFYSDDASGSSGAANNLPRGAIDLVTTSIYGSTHDMVFRTRGDTSTTALEKLRITSTGNVGIGTDSPSAALNIVKSGLSTQFRVSNTVSDATTKYGAIVGSHYTNAEEPITGMLMTSSSSATGGTVSIGGGISAANAVNNILFYTAANNTTLIGSEAGRFDSSGNLLVGRPSTLNNAQTSIKGASGKQVLTLQTTTDGNSFIQGYNSSTALAFQVRGDGDVYISGDLGIGTTSPVTPLHVSTAKSSVTDSVLTLQDTTETFGRMIEFVGQGSTDSRGIIGFQEPQANAPELFIANGGGDALETGVGLAFWSYINVDRISPCDNLGDYKDDEIDLGYSGARFKDLYLSGGVQLGGTGAANKLDDYEEGTWTPTLYAATTGTNRVTSIISATYTKIGRLVRCKAYLAVVDGTALNGDSGAIQLGGLPFTAFAYGHLRTLYSNLSSSSITGIVTGTVVGLRVDDSQVALQPSNINTGSNNIMIDVTFEA